VLIFLQYLRKRRFKYRAFTQHGIQQGESVNVEFIQLRKSEVYVYPPSAVMSNRNNLKVTVP